MRPGGNGWRWGLIVAGLSLCGASMPSPGHTPTREEAQEAARRAQKAAAEHAKKHGGDQAAEQFKAELAQRLPRPPEDPAAYAAALDRLRALGAEELFAYARYKGRTPLENIGENVQVGAAFTRAATMVVNDSPARLLALYRQALSGRPALQVGRLGPEAGFLAFREADGFMRTLTLVSMGESTLVLASVTDPERVAPKGLSVLSSFPADVPLPPLVSDPVDLHSEQGDFAQHTRQATTAESSADAVVAFFLRKMPEAGWAPDPGRQQTTGVLRMMVFSKGERSCTATIAPPPLNRPGCQVTMMCIDRRTPP